MMLNSVVLPAPFGPISPTIWPCSTSSDTSSIATIPPKRRVTFLTDSSATRPSLGQRQRAGEALADVHGRLAVDLRAPLEQRYTRGGPERDHVGRRGPGGHARGDRRCGVADDRELTVRREVLVERHEHPAERRRDPRQAAADQPEHGDAAPLELVVAPDPCEPQKDVREHRVAARRRMVVDLLLAGDERLAVGGRVEEPAPFV